MLVESIHYASKIQDALLPDKDALSDAIKDIHVCWKPLHVVGGDYFWLERIGDKCIIVIVDCTGHGVPGAFMTMVAASALDRILHDLKIFDPANILSQLDDMVRTRLKQDKPDSTSDDGLEAAVCVYNIQTKNLAYAGAGLPLISANNGEISEIRGTRTCLGYRSLPMRGPIETHNISVENGMSFYMLTDGVPDHMGGKPRRLLGRKHLHGIILKNHTLPMEEQMMKIQHALKEYSGSEPRRDDMTLIGFTPG
jgi:serine phosphatase RsbU (regulator of sigma subunit)